MTTNAPLPLAERKRAVRADVRARRRRRPEAERAAADAAISQFGLELATRLGASTVALFLSTPTEPGTRGLLAALDAARVRALVPRPIEGGTLEWVAAGGGERRTPGLGTPEPVGRAEDPGGLAEADLILIPAAAVSARGDRLGWGGGYYDRTLAGLRSAPGLTPVIAVVFDDEVRDDIPIEPHDVPVDGVLTPTGVRMFGAA